MTRTEEILKIIKNELEEVITTSTNDGRQFENGLKAKESYIRSSKLINYIHELVKEELINNYIDINCIFPPFGSTRPELKIAGFLKQKNQDICVIPKHVERKTRRIEWGPLQYENIVDDFGHDFSEQTLIINVRSQMSSLSKNYDTLFERTFAEAVNLHLVYPNCVLGEVYLIPVFEYDQTKMSQNQIGFNNKTNLEKYISFFYSINNRNQTVTQEGAVLDGYKYESICLLVVDFSREYPKVYNSTKELKDDGLISQNFNLELNDLSFNHFVDKLITKYANRFNIENIL